MKEVQERIKKFNIENKNLNHPIEYKVLDLVSEVGEVSKEILKMTDYGEKPLKYDEKIKGELGDVLYSLIGIANYFEIDLSECIEEVLQKYQRRLIKGSAGSENEN